MKKTKILILGGAGFIGSHLTDSLSQKNFEIVVLDNFTIDNKIPPNIQKKIKIIEGDVRDKSIVEQAAAECDAIVHLAALVGVDQVIERQKDTIEIETIGTRNVVAAAQKHGVQKIIYASSSAVYDSVQETPSKETDPVMPVSGYAVAKRLNELYLNALAKETNISAVSLRFFNVYGCRQDDRMVIPRFFHQAMNGQPIQVFGDGKQTRDFTHIDDVTNAITLLLQKENSNGIFNIAKGKETTILQLATLIKKITASNSPIELLDFPNQRLSFKVNRRVGCAQKLWNHLGIQPTINLEDGLKNYFLKLKNSKLEISK